MKKRVFDKNRSIFKAWKTDDETDIEKCAAEDFKYWKVPKISKDMDELDIEMCEQLVLKYYDKLKHIYITLISDADYPFVTWDKFIQFANECDMIDA